MQLNDVEVSVLRFLGDLEKKNAHQKHTPREVEHRFKVDYPEVDKSDFAKAWTVLVGQRYIREWTVTTTMPPSSVKLAYRTVRTRASSLKTTYCQLTDKGVLYLDGRTVVAKRDETDGVYDGSTPYTSRRALESVIESAKERIQIVDNYIGRATLDFLIVAKDVPIQLLTELAMVERGFDAALEAFRKQYKGTLEVKDGHRAFHGRFIIIDDQAYLIDNSIKQFAEKPTALIPVEPAASNTYVKLFRDAWAGSSIER